MSNIINVVKPSFEILTPKSWIDEAMFLLEKCGRTCYKSEEHIKEKSHEKFVDMIVKSGHESVIEHFGITVKFVTERMTSHQLVRHRIASYSQESQRYCDYGKKGFTVICPPSISEKLLPGSYTSTSLSFDKTWVKDNAVFLYMMINDHEEIEKVNLWFSCIDNCYATYLTLRDRKVKPEEARSVLPNCTKTEICSTFNLRTWRHIFKERSNLNSHAQRSMRDLITPVLIKFGSLMPVVFGDLAKKLGETNND